MYLYDNQIDSSELEIIAHLYAGLDGRELPFILHLSNNEETDNARRLEEG